MTSGHISSLLREGHTLSVRNVFYQQVTATPAPRPPPRQAAVSERRSLTRSARKPGGRWFLASRWWQVFSFLICRRHRSESRGLGTGMESATKRQQCCHVQGSGHPGQPRHLGSTQGRDAGRARAQDQRPKRHVRSVGGGKSSQRRNKSHCPYAGEKLVHVSHNKSNGKGANSVAPLCAWQKGRDGDV